jgi:hypothetical protein
MKAQKKKFKPVGTDYYVVTSQMPYHAKLFGMFGDCGLLIDPLKMLNIPSGRLDKLERIYSLKKKKVGHVYECNCGLKFIADDNRATHIQRRHLAKAPNIVDLQDLNEEQQRAVLEGTENYWTGPNEFHIPDPEDKRIAADDRRVNEEVVAWEKTAASQK